MIKRVPQLLTNDFLEVLQKIVMHSIWNKGKNIKRLNYANYYKIGFLEHKENTSVTAKLIRQSFSILILIVILIRYQSIKNKRSTLKWCTETTRWKHSYIAILQVLKIYGELRHFHESRSPCPLHKAQIRFLTNWYNTV